MPKAFNISIYCLFYFIFRNMSSMWKVSKHMVWNIINDNDYVKLIKMIDELLFYQHKLYGVTVNSSEHKCFNVFLLILIRPVNL